MSVLKERENELRVDVGVIFPSSLRPYGGQREENVGSVLQVCVYVAFLFSMRTPGDQGKQLKTHTYLQSLDVEQQMKRYTYPPSSILLMVFVEVDQQVKTYTYPPCLILLMVSVGVEQQVKTYTYLQS